MKSDRESLWRSTDSAHAAIQHCAFDLKDIARRIEYLHPKMATELDMIAREIESARKTIQGNDAQLVNMDLKDSEQQVGKILVALLDKAGK